MDYGYFRQFLDGLEGVSGYRFMIADPDGFPLLSEGPAGCLEGITELAVQIVRENAFRFVSSPGSFFAGVPLMHGSDVAGSLIACSNGNGQAEIGKQQVFKLEKLLVSVSSMMEEKWAAQRETEQMSQELAQLVEHIYLYSRIAPQIKTLSFSGGMLKELIGELLSTMRMEFVFSLFPGRPELDFMVGSRKMEGLPRFIQKLFACIPPDSPSLAENYFVLNDSRSVPAFAALHPDPFRFLAVRIQDKGKYYGWLGMASFNMRETFRRSELRLLISISEQVAGVITNSELYGELERFVINVVESLVAAIEAKDIYTRGHSERVNRYCLMIADEMGMEAPERSVLHWAAILHDVGKIGIPESILNKPGRLDDEEFLIIKSHPEKGFNILKPLAPLAKSLEGILHHHERFGGGGYPRGLKGEDIPFHARIIAVADTFDAVNSDRAYRSAKHPREALRIVEESAGTQLDPDIVRVFMKAFPSIISEDGEK